MNKPKVFDRDGYLDLKKCKKCGKEFIAAPLHIYKENNKYYCSWTCFNHRNDKKEGEEMAVNSKQKGARFERLLASKLREYGYEARRTAQYCGNTGDASDVVGLPGLHIEAKHQERMHLYGWMAQAKWDAEAGGKGNLPAVFHKQNNASILVTMELDDFMTIYREWEAGLNYKKGETT